jgi:hypothetical protein
MTRVPARFGLVLRFHFTAGENMRDGNGARGEMPSDQQKSMAVERIAFGAHERDSMSLGALDDPFDTGMEQIGAGHRLIAGAVFFSRVRDFRPPTQLSAQKW